MTTKRVRAPEHLGVHGKKLWLEIAPPKYELRPDELRILEECCREVDIINRLEEAMRDDDLMVAGNGLRNLVVNPIITELRQHRATLTTMLKTLQLPDTAAGTVQRQALISQQATSAARARWDKVRAG